MASEQLARVKAEIKAWERAFRAEHGRDPTKDDMKAAAGMPERYRLYKDLSNHARPRPSAPRHASDHPPSHARNPFSPTKRAPPPAASASARAYLLLDDARVVPNPFSTPPRSRGRTGKSKRNRSPSPADDFDADFESAFPAIGTARPQDTPTTRARKRLRGEHVPPSPDKPARTRSFARVQSESVPAPKSAFFSSSKQALDDDDDALGESPAKPADTNKNFRPIFDETPPDKPAAVSKRTALTRSKTLPVFARVPTKLSQRLSDGESSDGDDEDATGPVPAPVFMSKAKPKTNGGAPMPSPPSSSSVTEEPTKKSLPSGSPHLNGNSRKRALPDVDEGDEGDADAVGGQDATGAGPSSTQPANAKQAPISIFSGLTLLPPSPPAVKASWQPKARKAPKPGAGPRKTKKPRLEEQAEGDAEDDDEDKEEVREVRWRSHGKLPVHPDADDGPLDDDGVLAEWEREMRLMQQRAPISQDEQVVEETPQQVAVDVHADTLALLALDDAPDRRLHHTRRAERAIIRDLLLAPSGAARALGRAEDVWAPGEFDEEEDGEGASQPAVGEDDDWDEEGMRWDEAEL